MGLIASPWYVLEMFEMQIALRKMCGCGALSSVIWSSLSVFHIFRPRCDVCIATPRREQEPFALPRLPSTLPSTISPVLHPREEKFVYSCEVSYYQE